MFVVVGHSNRSTSDPAEVCHQDRSVTEDAGFLEYDVDYVSEELAVEAADQSGSEISEWAASVQIWTSDARRGHSSSRHNTR